MPQKFGNVLPHFGGLIPVRQGIDIVLNASDEDGPDYDLVCPSCACRCVGKTRPAARNRSTYRNVYLDYDVWRVVCVHCGLVKEMSHGGSLDHRYWYRIKIGEDVFWAVNEARLRHIRDVLAGNADRNDSFLYALPKWLMRKGNRSKAITQIDQMLIDPALRRICDA